jgi:tRNA G18 (ribose-2'-O)-methylase SpoU
MDKTNRKLVLIIHNVRSAHNVGSMLRTAEGLGIDEVVISGFSPYPATENDRRLPHEASKIHRRIAKTSLGAEKTVSWKHEAFKDAVSRLKTEGYVIAALEQTADSVNLTDYSPPPKIALIAGNEVEGLDSESLRLSNVTLEIKMLGQKESFNVGAAAAMALFYLKKF